jgi:hypothetical protein
MEFVLFLVRGQRLHRSYPTDTICELGVENMGFNARRECLEKQSRYELLPNSTVSWEKDIKH